MAKHTPKLDDLLEALRRADREVGKGRPIADCAAQLRLTEKEFCDLISFFSLPTNCGKILSSCELTKCIFPICERKGGSDALHQIATGLLVEMGGEFFVLTAAHVVSRNNGSGLFMPGLDGRMITIRGSIRYTIPDAQPGKVDRLDFAYVHLDRQFRCQIHPSFIPARLNQLATADDTAIGELYTFAGYPWRKSASRNGTISTDLFTFSGYVASDEKYEALGYNRKQHIVVRFRRRRTYATKYASHQTSPHPHGISGGIAMRWPDDPQSRSSAPVLKITGIAHTFHESENCLVATNIACAIRAIAVKHSLVRQAIIALEGEPDYQPSNSILPEN
jgi:hypothetical protein